MFYIVYDVLFFFSIFNEVYLILENKLLNFDEKNGKRDIMRHRLLSKMLNKYLYFCLDWVNRFNDF